jgi:hypothetical protein
MLRSKTTGLLTVLAALTAVLVPATADAARMTYAVSFTAHRTVDWTHPNQVFAGDCNGDKYQRGYGSEDRKIDSLPGGRLVLEGSSGKLRSTEFGTEGERQTLRPSKPPEAKGVITRERTWITGRTGGWCGGAEQDPIDKGDCGTRLAPFTYRLSVYDGEIGIRETLESRTNENFGFYKCDLPTPEHVPPTTFPTQDAKIPLTKVFGGAREIVIKSSKDYGPARWSLGGGLFRESKATYEWKLTLKRVKNLTPRSENG